MLGGSGKLCAACGFVGVIGGARQFSFSMFLGMSGQTALGRVKMRGRRGGRLGVMHDEHGSMAVLKWQSFVAGGDLASLFLGMSRAETSRCINKMMLAPQPSWKLGFPLQEVFYDNMKVYKP